MARIWAQSIQIHSPISRQIAASSVSLVGAPLRQRRNLSTASRCLRTKPRSCSSSYCRPAAAAAPGGGPVVVHGNPISSFAPSHRGLSFASQHHLLRRRLSPSVLVLLSGVMDSSRSHITTGKATAGSEVGVGSGSKNQDREILVQHLLLKEDQINLLIELQRQITQEGLDLSDLAGDHSICPSKTEGGMLGWIKVGQTDPAFEEAAFKAPLNKVVRVKTKHGLHLLQVLSERSSLFLKQIQVEEFHERMQDPGFLEEAQLIDVREPDEISTAAIKGFEAYPLSQFGQWAPNISDDLDMEKDTYVLCHHGMRSMQAANWLQSQGFKRLYNIAGGIHAYSNRVDNTIPTY